jgi:predicted TIM-barrel fold metal-dependent hydrolase
MNDSTADAHHHFWDHRRAGPVRDPATLPSTYINNFGSRNQAWAARYLLDELLEDVQLGGHNVVSTVYLEAGSFYTVDASEDMAPVGETSACNGFAAITASDLYGKGIRACAGIVGSANMTLGAEVEKVLRAHIAASPNFRGIRHSCAWDADDCIGSGASKPHLLADPKFREGIVVLDRMGLSYDVWLFHTQVFVSVHNHPRTYTHTQLYAYIRIRICTVYTYIYIHILYIYIYWCFQILELADLARAFPSLTIIADHVWYVLVGTTLSSNPFRYIHFEYTYSSNLLQQ